MNNPIRSRCKPYEPESMPELKLFYKAMPGEVDVADATIHGRDISDDLYNIVVDSRRAEWESEIKAHLKKVAEDQAMDQAGGDWEIDLVMGRGAA